MIFWLEIKTLEVWPKMFKSKLLASTADTREKFGYELPWDPVKVLSVIGVVARCDSFDFRRSLLG